MSKGNDEPTTHTERVVDVMQQFVVGEHSRIRLHVDGEDRGLIEHFLILEVDDPVQITTSRGIHRAGAYETIEVSYG